MIKCEIWTYSNVELIQHEVERCYRKYEILNIQFSTTMYGERLPQYSVMIVYKEKQ